MLDNLFILVTRYTNKESQRYDIIDLRDTTVTDYYHNAPRQAGAYKS